MSSATINIAIGQAPFDGERMTSWEIWETDAPIDYDGFGTFQIMQYEDELSRKEPKAMLRTVLIRSEHWGWQTARYASGMALSRPSSLDAGDVATFLWHRISGKKEAS
jgi:hypothetical protein